MQSIEDKELIDNIKSKSCSESLDQLISKHSGLCYKIFSKFIPSIEERGRDYNELASNKDYYIYKAAMSYKEDKKARFSTWLGNYIRYKCLDFLNESKIKFAFISYNNSNFDEPNESKIVDTNSSELFNELERRKNFKERVFDSLLQLKDKRIAKVYQMRYFSNSAKMTWKKIGETMGVSTQTAINLHEKGKKAIKVNLK